MKQPSGTDGHGSAEDWATRDRDRGDARWSPIGHEELPWDVESDTSMSRRKRLQARGPYQAAADRRSQALHRGPHLSLGGRGNH